MKTSIAGKIFWTCVFFISLSGGETLADAPNSNPKSLPGFTEIKLALRQKERNHLIRGNKLRIFSESINLHSFYQKSEDYHFENLTPKRREALGQLNVFVFYAEASLKKYNDSFRYISDLTKLAIEAMRRCPKGQGKRQALFELQNILSSPSNYEQFSTYMSLYKPYADSMNWLADLSMEVDFSNRELFDADSPHILHKVNQFFVYREIFTNILLSSFVARAEALVGVLETQLDTIFNPVCIRNSANSAHPKKFK